MNNTGHGYVIPRDDGVKTRCGGSAICSVCAEELRVVQENSQLMSAMKDLTEDDLKRWADEFLLRTEPGSDAEYGGYRLRQ